LNIEGLLAFAQLDKIHEEFALVEIGKHEVQLEQASHRGFELPVSL